MNIASRSIIQRNEIGSVNIRVARNESRSIIYLDKFLIYSISSAFLYTSPPPPVCSMRACFQNLRKLLGKFEKIAGKINFNGDEEMKNECEGWSL